MVWIQGFVSAGKVIDQLRGQVCGEGNELGWQKLRRVTAYIKGQQIELGEKYFADTEEEASR